MTSEAAKALAEKYIHREDFDGGPDGDESWLKERYEAACTIQQAINTATAELQEKLDKACELLEKSTEALDVVLDFDIPGPKEGTRTHIVAPARKFLLGVKNES